MGIDIDKEKYKEIINEYSIQKDNFKSFIKCLICKLNEELNCSIDFNTLSEIEIFDLFLEYKLSNLDIEKKKFESSNNVGALVLTIAIGLFTCLFANIFLKEGGFFDKLTFMSELIRIIINSVATIFSYTISILIFYFFLIKVFDKNNKNILNISKEYYDDKFIYKLIKNKYYKEHINYEKNN